MSPKMGKSHYNETFEKHSITHSCDNFYVIPEINKRSESLISEKKKDKWVLLDYAHCIDYSQSK
jgi:hypothetical protein